LRQDVQRGEVQCVPVSMAGCAIGERTPAMAAMVAVGAGFWVVEFTAIPFVL